MNARELYEQHCARFASDDEVAWERLCAEHPQHGPELARLREEHIGWRALLRSLGTDQVQQRLTPASELESRSVGAALERMRARSRSDTRYKVQGEIGRGGMGVVLRVWDTEMGRTLAMKRIRGKESDGSAPAGKPATARLLARFLEEAQITGRLDHPGIVPVHEVGIAADGELYFTMRLVEGENLRTVFERVREGKEGWTITRALSVILRVCEAMSYAHHKGILHRDLKPSNIMVGRYGEAYVMDWGLARDLGDRDTHDLRWSEASEAQDNSADSLITRDGDIIGTPSYMSPEQALGETARIGPHSDVYSVGAMLYHLLSVDRISAPYTPRGSSPTARAVLQALRNAAPEPLVNAPAELIAITEKAMQRDIALRYPDMQALAADLRAYLEGQVVSAHATGALAEARKWVQRNRALTVALAGGLCALVGGLVFSLHFASESRANEQRVTLANISLDQRNQQLQTEARKARLRGMIQELQRFRAESNDQAFLAGLPTPSTQWWLQRATRLVQGVGTADAAAEISAADWQPGLKDVEAMLAELRQSQQLKAYTGEDARRDFVTHPEYAKLQEVETELQQLEPLQREGLLRMERELRWRGRMLGMEPWPEPSLKAGDDGLADWNALRKRAWELVEGDGARGYGEEPRALALARRALELAPPEHRAECVYACAMMLAINGQVENGLAAGLQIAEQLGGPEPDWLADGMHQLRTLVQNWSGENLPLRKAEWEALQAKLETERFEVEARIARARIPLERRIARLRDACSIRRTWEFASSEQQWWHDRLEETERDLRRIGEELASARLAFEGPEAEKRWNCALDSIARSPRYAGVTWPQSHPLQPQLGLLPIGENPISGLWEFVHLPSGREPARGADGEALRDEHGRLSIDSETGIIFILLPGGRVPSEDPVPGKNSWQPEAVTGIDLVPFFLAKHELTQEQWDRLGAKPWTHNAEQGDMLPVTMVSWQDANELWSETLGWLALPSGVQWEFACRAGTRTPWWTGVSEESLLGIENVRPRNGPVPAMRAVGIGLPNPFGFHDMHGNVWEWCADAQLLAYELPPVHYRPGDGLRDRKRSAYKEFRGGSHGYPGQEGQASFSSALTYTHRVGDVGLRVMRPVLR